MGDEYIMEAKQLKHFREDIKEKELEIEHLKENLSEVQLFIQIFSDKIKYTELEKWKENSFRDEKAFKKMKDNLPFFLDSLTTMFYNEKDLFDGIVFFRENLISQGYGVEEVKETMFHFILLQFSFYAKGKYDDMYQDLVSHGEYTKMPMER